MSNCRWDREAEDYMLDGGPCRWDEYGDRTHHCTARRGCANHVGAGELTCARCLGRTRSDIKRIADLAPLMLPVALGAGVNSEAANLAGPAADPEAWSWRKVAAAQGRAWHVSLIEDDDEHHPYSVLTRWEFMLREDYRDPRDAATSVSAAAAYLDRILHRIAQDDAQDFPLFAREMRTCRNHLEGVLRDSRTPERGAPCPACIETATGPAPRLVRQYGHWCESEECERFHHRDDSGDEWICPRYALHRWSEQDYRLRVKDWHDAARGA